MAKFNVVDKKVNMSLEDIVKFQIMTYCYIHKIILSESDLSCLTLLGLNKKVELSDFCNACCDPSNRDKDVTISYQKAIFKTPQTVRNCVAKMRNYNIITRDTKTVELNPELNIQHAGNILLNFKMFHVGTQES
ncbi:MAG TPA: hypothetical protein PK432_00875 [Candidatus Dojkabacteria bacterium]|jgi:hypothetical protein|nr:hypothetical protein [Candidatus Dojkabacteria bacterium]HPP18605.1 hypothetical protein [Candidatus Dojkabacteria bacterium]